MNFDRNTVFGFIALGILFIGYFIYNTKSQQAYQLEKARKDSIAAASAPKPDPVKAQRDSLHQDTAGKIAAAGQWSTALQGTEQRLQVENEVMKLTFSNKGGQLRGVELKNFKAPDSSNVLLAASDNDRLDYRINTGQGNTAFISGFYFQPGTITKDAEGNTLVSFQLPNPTGGVLLHQYVVRKDDYMVDLKIQAPPAVFTDNTIPITWHNRALQLQKDVEYEKTQSTIDYREDGDFDNRHISDGSSHGFEDGVQWVAVKQQFFNSSLITKDNFTSGDITWSVPSGNTRTIVEATANLRLKIPANGVAQVSLYNGPNDYKLLKRYGYEMEDMVNLGSGIFAFVKYINRWIILPVFDLFRMLTSNFGIVILLLTLFIRLITSPLMYPGYLNAAKMKVLRPELDELKKKYPDQQAYAMEQMKFLKQAGVDQIKGCLPGLLQIPIFISLYNFFNSNVALRGQGFLWSDDLSMYDSILNFGNVPLISSIYGSHVSLFTITAVITSFFISLYSMSSQPQQDNPVLKYMPYFFPIIMLFIFNKLPAALTWYYTVSNIITLLIQFVVNKYIINHDKVVMQIEVNRKKPQKKGWAEKMAEMQEQQRKLQEDQRKRK